MTKQNHTTMLHFQVIVRMLNCLYIHDVMHWYILSTKRSSTFDAQSTDFTLPFCQNDFWEDY